MDFQSWAELRESLREALDALENAKELIPWEGCAPLPGARVPAVARCVCASERGFWSRRGCS